jgi:hypothetical protein
VRSSQVLAGVVIIGLVAQAGFAAKGIERQAAAATDHHRRAVLEQIDRFMPADAGYAVTNQTFSDFARYFLYPRKRVLTGFSRAALERSGVRYVIVTPVGRPADLRGVHPWYRVILASHGIRLLELRR